MKAVIIFLAALYTTHLRSLRLSLDGFQSLRNLLTLVTFIRAFKVVLLCLLVECRTKVKWHVWMSRTKWQF